MSTPPAAAAAPRKATRLRDGLVVILALTTGAVNAVTFLRLGKVFASVMTGNLALFGVAAAQRDGELAMKGGLALAGYAVGVVAGAALARTPREGQPAWPSRVTVTLALEQVVLAGFSGGWLAAGGHPSGGPQLALLTVVSAAMGMQATAVRRLGEMSSTYLTSTVTALLEALAMRRWPSQWQRGSGAVCALVIGAVCGGLAAVQAPAAVPAAVMVPVAVVLACRLPAAATRARSRLTGHVLAGPIMYRHNREMLRTAPWGLRTIGLAVVGLVTFLTPPSAGDRVVTQAVAYAVLCLGVAGWALADLPSDPHPAARRGLPVALGAVAAAGCVGSTAGGGGYCMIAFPAVALMVAADVLPAAGCLAIVSLGVLATEVGGIVFSQDIGILLGSPLLLAVGVLFGRNRASLRVQAEQARQLLAQHEQLQAEHRRADVLEERARIAREVHDVLAHSLGALGIQLQTVRALITVHHDQDRALEALAAAQRMASGGLNETRRAVLALRTDTLPLHDELARATAEAAQRHQAVVRYQTLGAPVALPPEATVALTRIAQESLVNAVKHAPSAEITVDLSYQEDSVRLTVSNALAPGAPSAADGGANALHTLDAGYGLTGMRERLLLLGGSLEAGRRDGQWVVVAHLPLPAGPRAPAPPAGAPDAPGPSSTTAPVTREADL